MKKVLLLLVTLACISASCSKNQSTVTKSQIVISPAGGDGRLASFDGIKIKGDAICVDKTNQALDLIRQKSPKSYVDVKTYIGEVECVAAGSGMYAYENPPRFAVGNLTRDAGTLWYAGAIVHDANHSKLYNQYLHNNPGQKVPQDVWTGKDAEGKCLDAQYAALIDFGADSKTLEYVKSSAHSDYWEIPSRNW